MTENEQGNPISRMKLSRSSDQLCQVLISRWCSSEMARRGNVESTRDAELRDIFDKGDLEEAGGPATV